MTALVVTTPVALDWNRTTYAPTLLAALLQDIKDLRFFLAGLTDYI
jgi:hypothetical protein